MHTAHSLSVSSEPELCQLVKRNTQPSLHNAYHVVRKPDITVSVRREVVNVEKKVKASVAESNKVFFHSGFVTIRCWLGGSSFLNPGPRWIEKALSRTSRLLQSRERKPWRIYFQQLIFISGLKMRPVSFSFINHWPTLVTWSHSPYGRKCNSTSGWEGREPEIFEESCEQLSH